MGKIGRAKQRHQNKQNVNNNQNNQTMATNVKTMELIGQSSELLYGQQPMLFTAGKGNLKKITIYRICNSCHRYIVQGIQNVTSAPIQSQPAQNVGH